MKIVLFLSFLSVFVWGCELPKLGRSTGSTNISGDTASDDGQVIDTEDIETDGPHQDDFPCVQRVNAAGTSPVQDGLTWETAFRDVETAIQSANVTRLSHAGIEKCEVWVQAGVYHIYQTDSNNSVRMLPHVHLYGGFAGTETARDQRDWVEHITNLSGSSELIPSLRVAHVVTGSSDAILDGFVITAGQADNPPNAKDGSDFAGRGGGLVSIYQSPTIRNCRFIGNFAYEGGALYVHDGNPIIENTTFLDNEAYYNGGAVFASDSMMVAARSLFDGNRAKDASVMYSQQSDVSLLNTVVTGNGATALFSEGTLPASHPFVNEESFLSAINCTFYDNFTYDSEYMWINDVESYSEVVNSIVWGNQGSLMYDESPAASTLSHCVVDWAAPGHGNLNADPLMMDPENGSFWLSPSSPCIDAANGTLALELDANMQSRFDVPEIANIGTGLVDYVDIGAFEYQMDTDTELDECLDDPDKTEPGVCGCGVADVDADGDGVYTCEGDACDNDPSKTQPGVCGCGIPDEDTDGDGAANCNEGCAWDPNKTNPGVCGCGFPDVDTDGDGVMDCEDVCPGGDDSIDTDGDGIPDACDDGPACLDLAGTDWGSCQPHPLGAAIINGGCTMVIGCAIPAGVELFSDTGECEDYCSGCLSNGDCAGDEYCQFGGDNCGFSGSGDCVIRASDCPLVSEPVCGCDGVTYSSACHASEAGTSVHHDGPCQCAFDADGDGICDEDDPCPNDPTNTCDDPPSPCGFVQAADPSKVSFDAWLEANRGQTQNFVYSIVKDGSLITLGSGGPGKAINGEDVQIDTMFRIGTASFPITAVAALSLVDAGALHLDYQVEPPLHPVNAYLPGYRESCFSGRESVITVHQLLTHTAGFPVDYGCNLYRCDAYLSGGVSEALSLWVDAPYNPFNLMGGSQGGMNVDCEAQPPFAHEFSVPGAILAGAVIEAAATQHAQSTRHFREVVNQRVFAKANMCQATFESGEGISSQNSVRGNGDWVGAGHCGDGTHDGAAPYELDEFSCPLPEPARGIIASAADMGYFIETLLGDLQGGNKMLSNSTAQLVQNAYADTGGSGLEEAFGYGMHVGTYRGHATLSARGFTPGYGSAFVIVPESRYGVSILNNGGDPDQALQMALKAIDCYLFNECS